MADIKQAGSYELKSAKLKSYDGSKQLDVKNLIVGFEIVESMSTTSVRGSTTVFDGSNILETFPLNGEESIEFTYVDYFGIERVDTFMVYSINNIKYPDPNNQAILQYTLNFVSPGKLLASKEYIMRSYKNGVISDYVKDIYNQYYKEAVTANKLKAKELVIESTDGQQTLVVPNLSPEEAIIFFSRRAYNSASKTQTYRFFENRDKYYFSTVEYVEDANKNFVGFGSGLVDPKLARAAKIPTTGGAVPVFSKSYKPGIGPERQDELMYEIIDINVRTKVNTVEDLNYPGYKKAIYEIDVLNGTSTRKEYDHAAEFTKAGVKLPHSNEYIQDMLQNEHVQFVFKDYSSVGGVTGPNIRDDQFYSELYTKKPAYFYHYAQNTMSLTIYGRNTIFAGSLVDIQLLERVPGSTKFDKEKSGRYIVESVSNNFVDKKYTQTLTLTRYGVGA
jgi:hypothetical protein